MNFEEAGRQYAVLKDRLEKKEISEKEFEQSVAALVAVAPDGKEWKIDSSTGNWVEATGGKSPPVSGKTAVKTPETLLQFLSFMAKSLVKSVPRLILAGLLMSVLTWVAHTYIIAKVNDGLMYNSGRAAVNSAVHLQRTYFSGVNAFWGLLAYFLSSFFLRARTVGVKKWFASILLLPENIRQSMARDREKGLAVIVLGAFIALLFIYLYKNFMLGWVLAFGILLVLTAHFASLETTVLRLALLDLQKLLRRKIVVDGEEYDTIYLFLAGLCAGFALAGFWRTRTSLTLLSAVLLLLFFIFLTKKGLPKPAAFLLLVGSGVLLLEHPVFAWCEGGSLSRAGGNWLVWWGSDNSDLVRRLGLAPAAFSFVGGFLGSAVATLTSLLPSISGAVAPAAAGPYLFDDGREYHEGRNYTLNDGREYRVANGELVPVRELRNGEVYIDVDGDRKIWIGGQSWYEADWQYQSATTKTRNRAHRQHVDNYWEKRQHEIHEEQAALHARDESELAKDREIEEQRNKVRELLKESIRIQQGLDELKMNIANRSAAFANGVTRILEATKYVCDKSIDVLAKVTGPKGKAIRKIYRAASPMAGGVGTGMATGNWTDSMVDATGETIGNLIEDSFKTDRYKTGFEVFRGGAGEAWQQGREAYRKGESVLGAAATGFAEGAADKASEKVKEGLEEWYPGSKYSYTIGEKGFKKGYNAYKKGGDVGDVLRAAGSGYVDGAIDSVVDYGVGKVFDNLVPKTGAVDEKTMQAQMKDYQTYQDVATELGLDDYRLTWGDEMLEEWRKGFIYDQARDEAKKLATKSTQNVAKGKAFDDKLFG